MTSYQEQSSNQLPMKASADFVEWTLIIFDEYHYPAHCILYSIKIIYSNMEASSNYYYYVVLFTF